MTPADISLYLDSDNIINPGVDVDLDELNTVELDSNAELYGTIYAPNAAIDIDSNFQLFGSVVARRVHLDSNAKIHFDESLLLVHASASSGFETICWRVLPDK